ncbi:MAG: O-antigen ligase family protein [Beijerinckiaceae bacterium]
MSSLRNMAVWLLFASGFLVFIEPAPFEIAFLIVTLIFVFTGLRFNAFLLPMTLLLVLYNIGGGLSLINAIDNPQATWFVVISAYMAVMAIIIACIFSEDTQRRLEWMKRGYLVAAVLASITGIMGYFDIAGTFDLFTRYARAVGTFKDPNVFSTFLVLPLVYTTQAIILGTAKRPLLLAIPLLIMITAVFLSFSRGAWGVTVGALMLSVLLSFLTASANKTRIRIVIIAFSGLALLIIMLAVALQFDAIRQTFEVRASLNQSYDQGETGRFGNQLRSIPLLLESPNGLGPFRFREYFIDDPHNTFINAFASYGWLGGLSYMALIACTMGVGWKLVFKRTPWQTESIAIWSTLFFLILQGMQIDTDHWRHFYVLVGLTWGLMLASLRYEAYQRHQEMLRSLAWPQAFPAPTAEWPASTGQTAPR